MDGLVRLRRPEEVAELRGLTISQVLGMDGNGSGAAGPVDAGDPPSPAEQETVPPTTPPAAEAEPADAEVAQAEGEQS